MKKTAKTLRITSSNSNWFPILKQLQKTEEIGNMFEKSLDYSSFIYG